ncbi:MAG: DUF1343 domain-containing protein, partial [Thermotogaceae bacterium]|nr:DUF1343 domain-containing protein [Thermotogaceae bacterium]
SAINKNFEHILDIAAKEKIKVVRVFTPEHGLFGVADGKHVNDMIHPKYGYPVISLYGKRKKPEKELLEDLDVVIFDIQDVGLRYFTYIYTLAYTMETAAETSVKFIVFDRVNPLGRKVVGMRISDDMATFVGGYRLPLRYGLTIGELSLYYKKLLDLDLDLEISKLEGWSGETFPKTGLFWNLPSPNLPTYSSLLAYTGMAFFEGTNLSHGRGTTKPFEFVGAPWVDQDELYEYLEEKHSEIYFRKRDFVPMYREYTGEVCHGIEFFPKEENDFYSVAIDMLKYFKKYEEFKTTEHLDRLAGVRDFINNLDSYDLTPPGDYIEEAKEVLLYGGDLH